MPWSYMFQYLGARIDFNITIIFHLYAFFIFVPLAWQRDTSESLLSLLSVMVVSRTILAQAARQTKLLPTGMRNSGISDAAEAG